MWSPGIGILTANFRQNLMWKFRYPESWLHGLLESYFLTFVLFVTCCTLPREAFFCMSVSAYLSRISHFSWLRSKIHVMGDFSLKSRRELYVITLVKKAFIERLRRSHYFTKACLTQRFSLNQQHLLPQIQRSFSIGLIACR